MINENVHTIVFGGNLRKMGVNPFNVVSPFGEVIVCGIGDAFAEKDALEARIAELEAENEELKKAISKPWMGSARAAYLGEKDG